MEELFMKQQTKDEIKASIQDFRLPRYMEIPDTGFYLEQTAHYVSEYLAPLEDITITSSMLSNYVKKKLIANPVKKQYNREQIAHLIFIAVAKTVLSIDDLRLLLDLQRRTYSSQKAYDYFCTEFENIIFYVFGLKDHVDEVGVDSTDEKMILRNTIISVAHKVYMDKFIDRLRKEEISDIPLQDLPSAVPVHSTEI